MRKVSKLFKNQRGGGFPAIEPRIVLFLLMVFFGFFFGTYKTHGLWAGVLWGLSAVIILASPILLILFIGLLGNLFRWLKNSSKPKD